MHLEGEAWSARFRDFTREAFRLELLPQYLVPQEHETFAAWRAGAVRTSGEGAWQTVIQSAHARDATVRRVHVVTSPLSEYLRFEFDWYYRLNAAAGEEIRILDLAKKSKAPDLPLFDFWMFDEHDVVAMLYEPDGTQIGRELLENADLAEFVRYRDAALAASVPFGEYWQDAATV